MMTGIAAYDELGMTEVPGAGRDDGDRWDGGRRRKVVDAVIIWDIHLGSENCQAKAIGELLQAMLDGELRARRLIINGDVFDSIDFRRLKKTHWKVLSLIRHLSDKLEIIWIAGNHDGSAEIVSHLLGVRVEELYVLETGEGAAARNLLVVHGHQFDDFINDHPVLTWLADGAYWVLQKLDRTHYVARLAKRRSKVFVRCAGKIRSGAMEMAERMGCDGAICGHTHNAEASEGGSGEGDGGGVAYYNSGCWTEMPGTYLVVDNGRVMIESWEHSGLQSRYAPARLGELA